MSEPWTKKVWVYDLRTNKHFTLKTKRLTRAGVLRCFSRDCVVLEGGPREDDAECCGGTFDGGTCYDETCTAGFECLPDLTPCAFSDRKRSRGQPLSEESGFPRTPFPKDFQGVTGFSIDNISLKNEPMNKLPPNNFE